MVTFNLLQHFVKNNLSCMLCEKLKSLGGVGQVSCKKGVILAIENAATDLLKIPKSCIDNFMKRSTNNEDCKKSIGCQAEEKW